MDHAYWQCYPLFISVVFHVSFMRENVIEGVFYYVGIRFIQ